jgi:hypothetical protein
LALTLQTGNLPVGTHTAELSITSGPNPVRVVVTFVIEPLAITHLRTDRASNKVYAISENTSVAGATAYLLEIDASTERILRTLPVGSSVTDVAIHQRENRVYVTNWQSGGLLAVNRDSFVVDQTYAFKSFAGIGYGDGDVFRVAAGANGRLVVEEADQWIDISIYNTYTGSTLGRTYVREGGGVFDSTGRYYYHGENNSSGAEIARFDSVGDVFTKVNSIRPANISYYGSRTVVISEDDSRIFWAYAMLDAQLNFLWGSGETIYACNENGRLAFSETKIYDTSRQLAVLGMPVSTRVSAYHSGTRKLVTAVNGQIFFHTLALPISNLPAPNALSGSVSNSLQAQISWADQSLETRFELQYRIAGASDWTESGLAIAQNATTATLGALLQETTYEFRVRAVAAEVSSPWSTPLTLTTPTLPPSTPILEASYAVSADVAFLRWSTTAVHNEVQIESALVSAPDTWSLLVTLAAPSNSGSGSINAEYVDSSVAPSTGYRYRVRLLRGSLFSAYSSIGTIYTPALPAPTMPSSLVATPREAREVLLTWNDSTDETGYRVERRQGESAWSSMSTLPANTTSYLDTSVSSGQFYSYRVLATNSVGQTPSTTVEVLVARIGRLISDDFDPSIDNATWASIQGGSRIVGTTGLLDQGALWFGSQGARLASTLPVDVSYGGALIFEFRAGNSARDGVTWWENSDLGEGIVVEYSTTPGIWSQLALLDTLFPELSDWKAYRFALPSNAFGVAVSFRWRQLNNSGAGFDTWALDNVAVEGFLPPPPMAPSFITATAISARVVSITWSSTPDTTSYRVQRRTPSTPWQTVGQTGASTTFYTDQTAQPATSYSYQVIALNAAGESEPSQYAFVLTWSILQEWRFQNYGTLLETTEAADMADNGTGVPNLLRYAFNLTRDAPALTLGDGQSERGMPTVRIEGNRLKLAFLRRRDASQAGIRYIAEFSSDLRSWQAAGTIVIAEPVNEDFEYVVVQDDVLLQQGARYARVRVER